MTTRSRHSVVLLALLTWLTAPCACGPDPRALPRLRHPAPSDRTLHIRSLPAVNGVASPVYEVLMRPFHFEVPALTAVAELAAGAEAGAEEAGARGTLLLSQPHPPVGPLLVAGNLTGLPAGRLALQVHRWGDLRGGCDAATGPQFDPFMVGPGAPPLGVVGVVEAGGDGAARVHLLNGALALAGPHSVLGRSLVLRQLPMDPATDTSGGKALACGVIALARYQPPHPPPPPPTPPPSISGAEAAVDVEQLDRP